MHPYPCREAATGWCETCETLTKPLAKPYYILYIISIEYLERVLENRVSQVSQKSMISWHIFLFFLVNLENEEKNEKFWKVRKKSETCETCETIIRKEPSRCIMNGKTKVSRRFRRFRTIQILNKDYGQEAKGEIIFYRYVVWDFLSRKSSGVEMLQLNGAQSAQP